MTSGATMTAPKPIETDGNVHVMPTDKCHDESSKCWCEPELTDDFTLTGGVQVWLHKETQ